jgi:Tetratricopeptide repeat
VRQPLATASESLNGQPGRRLPVFVLRSLFAVVLLMPALAGNLAAQAFDVSSLNELAQLARAGAPQLALKRMNAEQPAADKDLVAWTAWEQERLQILFGQGLFEVLIDRVDRIPVAVDPAFRQQALTLKADALLQLGEAARARGTLRELLWFDAADEHREMLARWRQLVIRSYVMEDQIEDARLALQRYRQDFGDESPQWRWLSAQVMLQAGAATAARDLLRDDDSQQGQFLHYSAELETSPDQAADIARTAAKLAGQAKTPGMQNAFWGLAAKAAARSGSMDEQIKYLEKALSLSGDAELTHGVLQLDADQLWDAYLARGKRIGNEEQKLLGNDEDWYFPATEAVATDPLRARILFAVLAEYGTNPQRQAVAHEYLVSLLKDQSQGDVLVKRLYLESDRYQDVDRLPTVIRYQLIDEALESGDLDTASRLMANLTAPASSDRFDWELRRARVAVFTGDTDAGVVLLTQLLSSDTQEWTSRHIDRLMQVVFDLQTVQHHEQALMLFTRMLDKPLEPQQRRELLFWMADSLQEMQRYDEAAYLYLKSATLHDPTAMDPWAQTARYRAAKALVEAGLLDDAQQIYTTLLRATPDASRKAVLQNELQRLHLVGGSEKQGGR